MVLFNQVPLLPFFSVEEIDLLAETGGTLLDREDWRRIAIIIQNVGSNSVWMRFDRPGTVGQGLLLNSGDIPLQLTFRDFGALITRSIHLIADTMDSEVVGYMTKYTPLNQITSK